MMMEHKRCAISFDQNSLLSLTPKRHKADISVVSKEKKEKTDTASVLLEAMEYIKFLQDQVKVLSAPYLCNSPTTTQDIEPYSLSSRGLCLVPIASTIGIASSNGADIWAPIKTASQKF